MRSRISCSWCRSRQQCSRRSWSWPQPGPPCQPHCQFGQPCTVTTFAAAIEVGASGAARADAVRTRPAADARMIARILSPRNSSNRQCSRIATNKSWCVAGVTQGYCDQKAALSPPSRWPGDVTCRARLACAACVILRVLLAGVVSGWLLAWGNTGTSGTGPSREPGGQDDRGPSAARWADKPTAEATPTASTPSAR